MSHLIDIYINPNYEYVDIFHDEINAMTLELNGKYIHANGKTVVINVHKIGDKFDDGKHGEYIVALCRMGMGVTCWYSTEQNSLPYIIKLIKRNIYYTL